MKLPITSRFKSSRGFKQKPSALKQTTEPTTVEAGGSTGTEDKIIPGKKGTPKRTEKEAYALRGDQYKDMDFATYQGVMRKDPAYGTSGTDDIPESTVKGDKKHYKGDIKIETRGDVLEPWEDRFQSRSIKKEGRDTRRSKIKAAKNEARGGGKFDKDGVYVKGTKMKGKEKRKYIKDARVKAKAEENKFEREEFEAASKRGKTARASGKRPGSTGVRTGERNMTRSEAADNQNDILAQKELIKEKAERDAAKKKEEEKGKADTRIYTPPSKTTVKSTPGFKQSTGAITPSALVMRKRSAFKMKGSMFNKK